MDKTTITYTPRISEAVSEEMQEKAKEQAIQSIETMLPRAIGRSNLNNGSPFKLTLVLSFEDEEDKERWLVTCDATSNVDVKEKKQLLPQSINYGPSLFE